MADFYSSQWGNSYSPQIRLSVSATNITGNVARITWILDYVTNGYATYTNGIARVWSVNIDGQVRSGSFNINGVSSTTRISSGTIDVSRTNSARNVSCSASLNFDASWNGAYSGSRGASGSIGISARDSHTVSFNANGGSGAPSPQIKWYGEILTLSSVRPTRTGYTFQGWCRNSATGTVGYQPSSQYGFDENSTMYAIWSPVAYTVTFDANGGSGAPSNQTKYHDQNLTLSSTRPTRANYNFIGWGVDSSSTTASYQPSSVYTQNSNITLYAIWELAYTAPRLTNVKADRSNSGGSLQEDGQYAKVTFNWATDKTISSIKIEWKQSTATTWASVNASGSDTSGSVTQIIGSNGLSTEYTYNVRITVADSVGSSVYTLDIPPMLYTIDFKAGGKGVAIGKPATEDNLFEINFPTRFSGGINYIYIPSGQNLNNYMTPGFYYNQTNIEVANIANTPVNDAFTLEVSKHNGVTQTFTRYNYDKPRTWIRNYFNGTWGSWFEVFFASDFNSSFDTRFNSSFSTSFNSNLNNSSFVVDKGSVALPYGVVANAHRFGKVVNLAVGRQIITWNATAENNLASERLPDWAIPTQEQTLVLQRNAGSFVAEKPTIIHLYNDGAIRWTSNTTGQHVFSGSITYFAKN